MTSIPTHVYLYGVFLVLLAAYVFGGKDPVVREMMVATFGAAVGLSPTPLGGAAPRTVDKEPRP